MQTYAEKFHKKIINEIAISKELLGLGYNDIMKMPLKDFYDMLKFKSEMEKKRQESLRQQQQQAQAQIRSLNKHVKL